MTHTWTCDKEGIRAPLTAITSIPAGIESTVFGDQVGVFLPVAENLDFGNEWSYNTLFVMDLTSPDSGSIQVSNDRQEQFRSEKFSQVTVPAGEFEVLEVSGIYTLTTDITFTTRNFKGTETLHFAEGVGLVRDYVEQDGAYFIELVDYFIPERCSLDLCHAWIKPVAGLARRFMFNHHIEYPTSNINYPECDNRMIESNQDIYWIN